MTTDSQLVVAAAPEVDGGITRADPLPAAHRDSVGLPLVVIGAFALTGLVVRIWVLRSPLGDADSDEAITGLMAMHFLDGDFRALYWGATYAGTLEPLITAVVFAVVGPSTIALKAVPIALTAVASLLLWRAARRYFGPRYGPLEAAVYWVYPAASVLLLMKAQVVYASGACFVVALLILADRMREDPRLWQFLSFGLIVGLAVWATPLALATAVPIGVAALVVTWRRPLMWLAAIPAAIVGALPWLWHGAENDWITLQQVGTIATTYRARVQGCFLELYPLLLGLRKPRTLEWVVSPVVGRVAYVLLFVAMIVVPVRRIGRRALPFVLTMLGFPFLYAISTTSWYRFEPRHGMFVAPVLLLLAVSLVPRRPAAQAAAFAVVVLMTATTLGFVRDLGVGNPQLATVWPGKLAPVLEEMISNDLNTCYADYWIAYRITFESEEDVVCSAYWGDRYPPYREKADASGARTYLFIAGSQAAADFRHRLDELRLPFESSSFETVEMFTLGEPRTPEEINVCVTVSWKPEPICPAVSS